MSRLGDFLAAGGARRREPGIWDCATFPAAWAMLCGHSDPMAALRGAYSTEEGAEHLIADAARRGEGLGRSGLEVLFIDAMEGAGVPEIPAGSDALEPGDIAVVRLFGDEAGAVYAGKRWAFVADRGMAFASLEAECVLRVWRPRAHG